MVELKMNVKKENCKKMRFVITKYMKNINAILISIPYFMNTYSFNTENIYPFLNCKYFQQIFF